LLARPFRCCGGVSFKVRQLTWLLSADFPATPQLLPFHQNYHHHHQQAQGELALEKFLTQTEEEWISAELELVNYQNKTMLIKGWQELFEMAKDRLASLSQMKLSPCVLSQAFIVIPALSPRDSLLW
jgi:hypothetical protein